MQSQSSREDRLGNTGTSLAQAATRAASKTSRSSSRSTQFSTSSDSLASSTELTKSNAKAIKPSPLGISLIDTSVSRHNGDAPRQVFPASQSRSIATEAGKDETTASLEGHRRGLSDSKKSKRPAPPPLTLVDGLSPFDREVPIILSVDPCVSTTEHGFPGQVAAKNGAPAGEHPSQRSAKTPTIIVTPSDDNFIRPYIATTGSISRRLRQPSSVYSQAITSYTIHQSPQTVPPPIPSNYLNVVSGALPTRDGQDTSAGEEALQRSLSNYTTFEDDEETDDDHAGVTEETPLTAEARANRISLETVLPTPRRSQGWWNLLSSPLFGRFSSGLALKSAFSDESTPNMLRRTRSSSLFSRARGMNPLSPLSVVSPSRSVYLPQSAKLEPVGEAAEYFNTDKSFDSPELSSNKKEQTLIPSTQHNTRGVLQPQPQNVRWPGFGSPDDNSLASPISPIETTVKHIQNIDVHEVHTRHITHQTIEEDTMSPLSPSPVVGVASVGLFQPARQVDAKTPSPQIHNQPSPRPALLPAASIYETDKTINQPSPERSVNGAPAVPNPFYNTPHGAARDLDSSPSPYPSSSSRRPMPPPLTIPNNESAPPAFAPPPMQQEKVPTKQETRIHQHVELGHKGYNEKRRATKRYSVGFGKSMDKRGKCILATMIVVVAAFITTVLVLVLSKTKHSHDGTPVQAAWANISNFPPIPTGVSTIAKTNIVSPVSSCVSPQEMWNCETPDSDPAPSFRIEIRYDESGAHTPTLQQQSGQDKRRYRSLAPTVLAGHLIQRARQLGRRDELALAYYTPNPGQPSLDEQRFLGHTTDNHHGIVEGEPTPFYISFLPVTMLPPTSQLKPRQNLDSSSTTPSSLNASNIYANLTSRIPPAQTAQNGSASLPELSPYPNAQPMHLYDRGLDTEHFGFYSYFDRSLLMRLPSDSNSTAIANAPFGQANAVCTFSQTRFRVQIFTKSRSLLSPPPNAPRTNNTLVSTNGTSSSNNFVRPGSFPLPVKLTLDRHGGDPASKGVYCYGLNEAGIVTDEKVVWAEDRTAEGNIVGAVGSPFADVSVGLADGGLGGIDGGDGGCRCSYSNFDT